jgi:epoxyqueuosine reductase QueG
MTERKSLKEDLVQYCHSLGIRTVKSISLESLEDAETLHEGALGLLPSVHSIISFARPFPRGAMHLMKQESRGLPFYSRLAGLGARDIDQKELSLCLFLEDRGFRAVPVFACTPMEMPEILDLRGYVSQIDLAARSGLGWIGKNGLLISPEHGTRVGIGTVLTDATLEHDAPLERGCPEDCVLCVEKCPAEAIDGSGKVDREKCTRVQALAPLSLMMAKEFPVKENLPMIINVGSVDEHVWYTCNGCVVSCPIGV